ncbi:NfeD family protein [Chengkuizengella axinellae]|uniref:Nodulation protein NfeD n=1 Tax=Chengkuizengella axinellae TaxID=3064388 RepID=A0ABT9IWC8_9BACL|nr:nodulation protein NfeD [Chengkuizengella sp. 2205SS18-9]MDP5273090.1 nodulation protein NfeD [Chengkuizengella sp. 2205SS18-9]
MKRNLFRVIYISALICFLISSFISLPSKAANDPTKDLVYVIPIEQSIETGLQKFLERAFEEAYENGADHIILKVNTFGGVITNAIDIGEMIRTSPVPTTAYIQGKALSAGSYISLNANNIMMQPGSSIGAAAIVDIQGNRVEDSKTIASWSGQMKSAAELNNRNPNYAMGMVDDKLVVEVAEIDRTYGKGDLISFTSKEAVLAGYAEGEASNIEEVLINLNIESYEIVEVNQSPAETLARFVTNPIVMSLLLLIGLVGVAFEVLMPGFGFPGILGVCAFALYFFGHYIAGFATIEHVLLFALGVVLLLIEIFVPSFGIFGVLGIISLTSSVILAASNAGNAMLSLLIAFISACIVIAISIKYLGHKGIWNRFILRESLSSEKGFNSTELKDDLLGEKGITLTPLRPSGMARLQDERVDVVTSGEFIGRSVEVIVVKVEGTRIVVREV